MNTRFLLLTLALLFPVQLYARDKTDIMVMTNGDRLTCEVKGLDAGVLYVSFDYIDGTAFVNWSKVARLESNQLFVVKTEGGTVGVGRSTTSAVVMASIIVIIADFVLARGLQIILGDGK